MWNLLKKSLSEIKDPHSKILLILLIFAVSVVFRINVSRYERDKKDMRQDLTDCKNEGRELRTTNDSLHAKLEKVLYMNQIQSDIIEEKIKEEFEVKEKTAKYLNNVYQKLKKNQ